VLNVFLLSFRLFHDVHFDVYRTLSFACTRRTFLSATSTYICMYIHCGLWRCLIQLLSFDYAFKFKQIAHTLKLRNFIDYSIASIEHTRFNARDAPAIAYLSDSLIMRSGENPFLDIFSNH